MATDWTDVLTAWLGTWPAAKLDEDTLTHYVQELEGRGVTPSEALEAVRRSGEQFPPSAAALAADVHRKRQGSPPGFMSAHALLSQRITMLPYHDSDAGMEALVESLAADGHEAVARYAAGMSARELRELPDPAYVQDPGGVGMMGRAEREYREVVAGWRADPRPGLALEMAREGAGHRIGTSGGMAEVVDGLAPAGELGPGGPS